MTSNYSEAVAGTAETTVGTNRLGRLVLLLGTPLLLGTLFLVHPDGTGGFAGLQSVADPWLFIHAAMLPLLGLLGVCFYVLLAEYTGGVATLGRVGVAVYLTFYVPFEAMAGLTTGLLVHEAQTLAPAQQEGVATVVGAVTGPAMVLGALGVLGALLAIGAAGVLLRRSGAPLVPVVLLGGAPLATVFHGGFPLDAVAMAAFVVGVAWLELGWRRTGEPRSVDATEQSRHPE